MSEYECRYFWELSEKEFMANVLKRLGIASYGMFFESDKNTNNPTYEEHLIFCLQMKENINSAQIKTVDLTNLNNDFGK